MLELPFCRGQVLLLITVLLQNNVQYFASSCLTVRLLCLLALLPQIFSKEEREKRRAALKEEMQRGYFDDFRDFRDKKGKVFVAPEKLIGANHVSAAVYG
jgi:hypothetical protein